MKKFLFMILSAILLFAACAKIDVVSDRDLMNQDDMEIVFQSNVGHAPMTKASIIVDGDKDVMINKSFNTWAYVFPATNVDAGYIIKNGVYTINKKNDNTTYYATSATKYYWPKADNMNDIKVNFFACFPTEAITDTPSENNGVVTYNVTSKGNNNYDTYDVMYAVKHQHTPVLKTFATAIDTIQAVDLKFYHLLSLIEFHAYKSSDIKEVKITKIEFYDDAATPALYQLTYDGSFTINLKESIVDNFTPTAVTAGSNKFTFADILDYTVTNSDAKFDSLIVIPQTVPNQIKLTFDITIQNTNGDEITYSGRTVTRTINSPSVDENNKTYVNSWSSNVKYIYRYYITADEIEFTIEIDDWDDNNPKVFDVWDHNETAFVDRFFDKASTMQAQNMVGIMA